MAVRVVYNGLELPAYQEPSFSYQSVQIHNGLAFLSGHIPKTPDGVEFAGKVGAAIDLKDAKLAARLATLNAISSLAHAVGDLDEVDQILKITVFVASAEGFHDQPKVADEASALMQELFGSRGRHARSAVGVFELPRNASVEVEIVAALRSGWEGRLG